MSLSRIPEYPSSLVSIRSLSCICFILDTRQINYFNMTLSEMIFDGSILNFSTNFNITSCFARTYGPTPLSSKFSRVVHFTTSLNRPKALCKSVRIYLKDLLVVTPVIIFLKKRDTLRLSNAPMAVFCHVLYCVRFRTSLYAKGHFSQWKPRLRTLAALARIFLLMTL